MLNVLYVLITLSGEQLDEFHVTYKTPEQCVEMAEELRDRISRNNFKHVKLKAECRN